MILILVRHGETRLNRDRLIQGINDLPLTDTGRAQARASAGALEEDLPFDLYSSPVARAVETGQVISEALQVPLTRLEGLEEADAGHLDGLSGQEMRRRYPEFAALWDQNPATAQMPGGESLTQVQVRAWCAVEWLLSKHPDGTVVAVTHNFTIQTIVCSVLDMPLNNALRLRPTLGSITRLELCGSKRWLLSLNERGHLQSLTPTEHGPFPR